MAVHSSGRQRGDGRPEGNSSTVKTVLSANVGKKNHCWYHAAARTYQGTGGTVAPGWLVITPERPATPVSAPIERNNHPIGLCGRSQATSAPTSPHAVHGMITRSSCVWNGLSSRLLPSPTT